jgi:hypothetical protein
VSQKHSQNLRNFNIHNSLDILIQLKQK